MEQSDRIAEGPAVTFYDLLRGDPAMTTTTEDRQSTNRVVEPVELVLLHVHYKASLPGLSTRASPTRPPRRLYGNVSNRILPAVYYNYDEATVGLYFIYFEEISVESPIA